jgi:hypothetical protein
MAEWTIVILLNAIAVLLVLWWVERAWDEQGDGDGNRDHHAR